MRTRLISFPLALERLAQEAVAQGDFISAVRYLFRACLVRLQANDERTFRPGMTNREYLRRFRKTSFVDSLALFVELIDTKWYGGGDCRREDYESCRTAYALIQQQMKDISHAHSA